MFQVYLDSVLYVDITEIEKYTSVHSPFLSVSNRTPWLSFGYVATQKNPLPSQTPCS